MDDKIQLYDENGEALNIWEIMARLPFVTDLPLVTRVEVVDRNGRSYINWEPDNHTKISFQDEGRTLKVFIGKK